MLDPHCGVGAHGLLSVGGTPRHAAYSNGANRRNRSFRETASKRRLPDVRRRLRLLVRTQRTIVVRGLGVHNHRCRGIRTSSESAQALRRLVRQMLDQFCSLHSPRERRRLPGHLVSDLPGLATITDPKLVNPWGVSHSTTSPFWTSNQGTNSATLYTVTDRTTVTKVNINPPAGFVAIPTTATGPQGPTG